jgi:hypothetical protein
MRTRLLAPLALTLAFGLWAEVCTAQAPSGTKSFDPSLNLSYTRLVVLNEGWGR